MGYISRTLATRFRNVRKYASEMRRQAKRIRVKVPKNVKDVKQLVESGNDPLFANHS